MKWSPEFLSRRPGRWVLIVRAGGARLFRGLRPANAPALDFAADATGYAELRRLLARTSPPPIHLLVDVVEEDFQREAVPHVFGRARREVTTTRSARLFHGTPYVSARREGRMAEGRCDDRILFSAIVRPERIEPWLDALRGQRIVGVHSLPLASARLLPVLRVEAARVLLVTESGERGLRQTCFEDGRFSSSRLAAVPPADSSERVHGILTEIDRFVHHLDRTADAGQELEIRLVADERLLTAIRKTAHPGKLVEGLVDTDAVERVLARRGRVRSDVLTGESGLACDRLFVRLALSAPPPDHYGPAAVLAVHRSTQVARVLRVAGVSILLVGAAWSGFSWQRSAGIVANTETLVREAHSREERYRMERPPEAEVALHDLRLAVETAQRLDANRVRALPILQSLSEALADSPDLELDSLEWFEVSEREGWPDLADADAPREQFRNVRLRGRVEPFGGHYRAATEEVFRFVERLEALPRMSRVEVLEIPEDPGGNGYRPGRVAEFEVRMVVNAGSG